MGTFRVSQKAIIEKDGKILVLRRGNRKEAFLVGTWDVVGGRIEFGEMPESALKREVKEETGLEIEIVRPFKIWSYMVNEEIQTVGTTVIAKHVSGDVQLSWEHDDYKWIEPEEFESFVANDRLKAEIKEYAMKRNG